MLGFMTFTNGNQWLGIDPLKNTIPLFDSCGHIIHRSCQMRHKFDPNRVYIHCPLCKSPANILIPEKEEINGQDARNFVSTMQKIYQTMEYKVELNEIPSTLEKSLVFEILFKGCIYEE